MTFDDMERQWKSQDEKLDTLLQINLSELRRSHVDAAATALQRIRRSIGLELFVDGIALLLIGSFIGDHFDTPRFLIPALLLHVCAIASFGVRLRQLLMLRQVDYAGPIVHAQRALTSLRRSRIRAAKWTMLVAPLLWVPLLIVGFEGFFGIDAYRFFETRWIAANLLFGAALIPLMLWLSHRYGDRLARSPFLQRLADDLAGRSLGEANAFLGQIARFEN
jgi:hypothetical protein